MGLFTEELVLRREEAWSKIFSSMEVLSLRFRTLCFSKSWGQLKGNGQGWNLRPRVAGLNSGSAPEECDPGH